MSLPRQQRYYLEIIGKDKYIRRSSFSLWIVKLYAFLYNFSRKYDQQIWTTKPFKGMIILEDCFMEHEAESTFKKGDVVRLKSQMDLIRASDDIAQRKNDRIPSKAVLIIVDVIHHKASYNEVLLMYEGKVYIIYAYVLKSDFYFQKINES